MFSRRLVVAAVTAVLIAGLGACGRGADVADQGTERSVDVGQDGGSLPAATRPDTDPTKDASVFGLLDEFRHLSAKTGRATRPHMVKKCTTTTERVKHTKSTGSGAKRSTRTWYSTEKSKDCKQVRSGTETYTRVVRPERWCVSLDDVGGDAARDDVWYRVSSATYHEAVGADKHARMEFTPTGSDC
ncbi:hypothetical protein FNH09_20310 [Streptomyces adustus]|uniref:Lipoprotein n=1 Tax=Streptomyces adustus TaxID=1609272 RepID=A0A5N8VHP3_9ACTN|nr:hypothetical protein [Streptomyces adustus]MPY33505.1 hypothetical protein [Streptomyces adustus]